MVQKGQTGVLEVAGMQRRNGRSALLAVSGMAALIAGLAEASAAVEPGGAVDLLARPMEAPAGWGHFSEAQGTGLSEVWTLTNGVLTCRGAPRGYLKFDRDLADFDLSLEWRRPAGTKPGRAGVLIRVTGPDRIWPRSLEAQLNAGQAGDFWGLGGFALDGPAERKSVVENPQQGRLTNLKRTADPEKPAGAWNLYEISARGDVVTLRINGVEVNRATGCDTNAGRICLTAEGDPIEFRNVRLRPAGGEPGAVRPQEIGPRPSPRGAAP